MIKRVNYIYLRGSCLCIAQRSASCASFGLRLDLLMVEAGLGVNPYNIHRRKCRSLLLEETKGDKMPTSRVHLRCCLKNDFYHENKFEMSREVYAKTSLDLLSMILLFSHSKSVSNSPEHSRSAADLIKAQNRLIAYGKHQVLQIMSHMFSAKVLVVISYNLHINPEANV